MKQYWIIKKKLQGDNYFSYGVATKCVRPKGVKNKYHIAFDGAMIIDFIEDIEQITLKESSIKVYGFAFNKLNTLKKGLYRYDI